MITAPGVFPHRRSNMTPEEYLANTQQNVPATNQSLGWQVEWCTVDVSNKHQLEVYGEMINSTSFGVK